MASQNPLPNTEKADLKSTNESQGKSTVEIKTLADTPMQNTVSHDESIVPSTSMVDSDASNFDCPDYVNEIELCRLELLLTTENPEIAKLFSEVQDKDNHHCLLLHIEAGKTLYYIDSKGNTLFHYAYQNALNGKDRCFEVLLKYQSNIIPLYKYIFYNNTEKVKACLAKGVNPNFSIAIAFRPLFPCSQDSVKTTFGCYDILSLTKNVEILKAILDARFTFFPENCPGSFEHFKRFIKNDYQFNYAKYIHVPSDNYLALEVKEKLKNLLIFHIKNGNLFAILEMLYDDGLPAEGFFENTLLYYAFTYYQPYLINILIQFGANVNQKFKSTAPSDMQFKWGTQLTEGALKTSLNSLDSSDSADRTPLISAVKKDDLALVKFLLNKGADFYLKENFQTALSIAASSNALNCLKYFISTFYKHLKLVNVNHVIVDDTLTYAVSLSAFMGRYESTKLLLTECYFPFLDVAQKQKKLSEILLSLTSCVKRETQLEQIALARFLIDEKVNVNQYLEDSYETGFQLTPLAYTITNKNPALAKFLISETRVDVNQLVKSPYGHNALFLSIYFNQIEILQQLIQAEVDLNSRDENGNTCLHFAASLGRIKILQKLLKHNLNLEVLNKKLDSPLTISLEHPSATDTILEAYLLKLVFKSDRFKNDLAKTKVQTAKSIALHLRDKIISLKDIEFDTDYTFYVPTNQFIATHKSCKVKEVIIDQKRLEELINIHYQQVGEWSNGAPLSFNARNLFWETSNEKQIYDQDTKLKADLETSKKITDELFPLELVFTNRSRSELNITKQINNALDMISEIIDDIKKLDEILQEKSKQSKILSQQNPNKRDRSKCIQKSIDNNKNRTTEIDTLNKQLENLKKNAASALDNFYTLYDKNHVAIVMHCDNAEFNEALRLIAEIKTQSALYEKFFNDVITIIHSLESFRDSIRNQFKKHQNENSSVEKQRQRAIEHLTTLSQQRESDKLALEAQIRAEQLKIQAQKIADAQRQERYRKQREAYRMARDAKLKEEARLEAIKKGRKQRTVGTGFESKLKHDVEDTDSPSQSTMSKSGKSLLFTKHPKPFTLFDKGNFDSVIQHDIKSKVETELNTLNECILACIELNEEIDKSLKTGNEHSKALEHLKPTLKLLGIQRSALLGSFTRALEFIKRLKGEENLPEGFARKFRNYLYKGQHFMIGVNHNLEDIRKLNYDTLQMVIAFVHYLKSEAENNEDFLSEIQEQSKAHAANTNGTNGSHNSNNVDPGIQRLDLIESELFQKLKKEAMNFQQADIPKCNACLMRIELLKRELDFYQKCRSEKLFSFTINPILIACAEDFSIAARGTLTTWIRDNYHTEYVKDKDRKKLFENYILLGNQSRHGDSVIKTGAPGISFGDGTDVEPKLKSEPEVCIAPQTISTISEQDAQISGVQAAQNTQENNATQLSLSPNLCLSKHKM